jgi:hypothetical protein
MNFESLIGQTIPAIVPIIHPEEIRELKIDGVDLGGTWVESKELTDGFLGEMKVPAMQTPIFFLPFHQIKFAICRGDSLSLSEKAYGL